MFVVNTNVAKDSVPAELLSEATQELAKAMGKPAQVSRLHFSRLKTTTKAHFLCIDFVYQSAWNEGLNTVTSQRYIDETLLSSYLQHVIGLQLF